MSSGSVEDESRRTAFTCIESGVVVEVGGAVHAGSRSYVPILRSIAGDTLMSY